MSKICCTIVASLFALRATAQTIDYNLDADKLYAVLQKTPSYKAQIKGDKADRYQQIYQQIKKDLPNAKTQFDRFYILSQLLVPLRDNHLFFSQVPEKEITNAMAMDTTFNRPYRASAAFKDYPRSRLKLDSLENVLKTRSKDSVEGIYYYERAMKVGLYRTTKRDSLVAVVLESYIPTWGVGQIGFILKEDRPNHFLGYQSHILNKTFYLQKNEKFIRNMLTESYWKKLLNVTNYVDIKTGTPYYQLKNMDEGTQYLRLGTFSTTPQNIAVAQEFYNRIKDSLMAPTLIVDLRNNGGGGFKTSQKFVDLLKKYTSRGKVYAIINNRTGSNAEQFTIELKKMKNVIILGETTNGTITYGNNYGNTETLPSGKFKLYITDMQEGGNYLPYESIGVVPDVLLKTDSDWIAQVMQLIAQPPVVK